MESQSHLGIYLRQNQAAVVCLSQGKERKLLDCFSICVEDQGEQNQQLLADRIARVCKERKVRFTEAAVALDCAAFMQHTVHSEFRDPRKIAATIRFDTEEALATDVSDVAVAFRIASSNEDGANLDVFTAQRGTLSDIILSLQSNGIDPVSIDPDVHCLSRYLLEHAQAQETPEHSTLYALLSDCRGYLIVISGSQHASVLRTFPIGPAQDRDALLARETLVTTGLADTANPVGRLCIFDSSGKLTISSLQERTGLDASAYDLTGLHAKDAAGGANAVDFALAYGAALALSEKANTANLRNDHMPYLGRKRRIEKAVRFLSISLTILLLAVGVFFHSQLLVVKRDRATLRAKLEPDYRAVMRGKKFPATMKEAVSNLGGELRFVRADKQGIGANQESISARLTAVLQGLNYCAGQADLNVDSITVTANNITINGDTSSRHNTVGPAQEAMKKAGLDLRQESADSEGGRDRFIFTLEPLKATKKPSKAN